MERPASNHKGMSNGNRSAKNSQLSKPRSKHSHSMSVQHEVQSQRSNRQLGNGNYGYTGNSNQNEFDNMLRYKLPKMSDFGASSVSRRSNESNGYAQTLK